MTQRDQIFDNANPDLIDFVFDDGVAAVFPDMIRRSVPGYELVNAMTAIIAARHLEAGSRCYDLGCAAGAAARATRTATTTLRGDLGYQLIGVDNSEAMLAQAKALELSTSNTPGIEYICSDCQDIKIEDASVVIMTFTLQFLPPAQRLAQLRTIKNGLRAGGVLLLAEKLAGPKNFVQLHEDFKRANGYSELEIAQKRSALEAVMIPETAASHVERLHAAGFGHVQQWYQCLNWGAFIARL